jgi:tripeptidyl-peptidase-2
MPDDLGAIKAVEAATGEQPLDDAQKALVEEVYSRLRYFIESDQEIHDRAKDARKILLLNDPYQDEAEEDGSFPNPPTIQLQSLVSTFNNCVADQMDNMPEATLLPERPDLQQQAEDLTDVVRYNLMNNNYETIHRKRVEDFIGTGTSVIQVVWDEDMDFGRGNIAIIRWPVEAFLWDPLAENLQDSRAVIKVSWHPLSWFAAHFPDAPHRDGIAPGARILSIKIGDLRTENSSNLGGEMRAAAPCATMMAFWPVAASRKIKAEPV